MQHENLPMSPDEVTTLPSGSLWASRAMAGAGLVVLALALLFGWMQGDNFRHFFHAYLTSYCYFLSIALGALFFVIVHHASRAGWSVAIRRVMEIVAANVFVMAVLFLPILLGALMGGSSLYEWTDAAKVQGDQVLEGKQPYLNLPFFVLRAVIYFCVWGGLIWFLGRKSVEQDASGDVKLSLSMERLSYPALMLFALTITFASFDWMMSLTPHWFSTAYGVYYFSGAVVGGISAIILLLIWLQSKGRLATAVTVEHYQELGKLLFAFIVFWGYIAFSQYMLIWYANIPEETDWYQPRQKGVWIAVSLVLLFGHLLIPFFGLMSRHVKRTKMLLGGWAVWMLIVHWIDIFYLVMPDAEHPGINFGLTDLCCLIGIGLVFVAGILTFASGRDLIPVRDPRLSESLGFENL